MTRSSVPWLVVLALLAYMVLARGCSGVAVRDAVARAEAAESALDSLGPITDSLRAEAAHRDTTIITLTDTIRVTIERVRVVASAADSALRATLDSAQVVILDELQAAHATEVAALEVLLTETRLWGQAWKDAAEALEVENAQLRLRGDAWESAYKGTRGQNRWLKAGGLALLGFVGYDAVTGE